MTKKLLLPLLLTALFITAVGILLQKTSTYVPGKTPTPTQFVPKVTINEKEIKVEIAKTSKERTKGLGERSSLDTDYGMLFVFDSARSPVFWMKDMKFPIDIIWIKSGKIVKIDKNVPVPKTGVQDTSLPKYSAQESVDYVLEVNAGFSDSNSIKVGDSVSISGI